jgi:Helix-turn-helix domain
MIETTDACETGEAVTGSRKYESWGIHEAAAFLHIHPTTLAERARGGEIPGCKVGRSWVFMPELLVEYLRTKSTTKVEQVKQRPSASTTLAERLAARRAQRIDNRRRSSRDPS